MKSWSTWQACTGPGPTPSTTDLKCLSHPNLAFSLAPPILFLTYPLPLDGSCFFKLEDTSLE